MIDVTVRKDRLTVSGHANYATKGEDVVCAAVTILSLTTLQSLVDLTKDEILHTANAYSNHGGEIIYRVSYHRVTEDWNN